jgi:hypothetical protein
LIRLTRISKPFSDPTDAAIAVASRTNDVFNTGDNVKANAGKDGFTNLSNAPHAFPALKWKQFLFYKIFSFSVKCFYGTL